MLETDKVTMTINAQQAGRIKIVVPEEDVVKIGQVVAKLDTDAKPEPAAAKSEPEPEKEEKAEPETREQAKTASGSRPPEQAPASVPQSEGPPFNAPAGMAQAKEKAAARTDSDELSPAVRRMVAEFHLDPGAIPATGKDGRLTKEDVVRYMDRAEKDAATQHAPRAPEPAPKKPEKAAPHPAPEPRREPGERQSRVRMTPFRQRAAERLVLSQQSTATLTTFNEVDMTRVMALREQYKGMFQEKYGVKLGFMSFFLKAAVDALKTVPEVNASIQGDEIVVNHFFDIGVAVGTEHGLVVPVVRDVDKLSFGDLEAAVHEMARKANEKSLTLADLSGGVFTVSNGGVYGNLLSTPILNPPQSAILGMHAIKKRPVAVGDELALRPMMYVAMSYDHRIVDGREAVTFLKRIVECIESPERLMLEI
ncbi:MAG: 2-oxoglutarate dehydrogenase complex dihydrolipoyllysine-residue succinyltransferase [Acidobacteriota bacterium]